MSGENQRQEVGDYILGQLLGEGTTGKVKLAMHKETGEQVAIKIIKKSMFDVKPDLQRKIRREIALMRLLDHPHIMKLKGVCESPRHLYIILEFEKHGELFDYLVSRRKLTPAVALNFFRQLIYGLDYLHAHAICHRDLKPENILLDEFDHVKIADFGFARWMRTNIAETSCGSPHYAAPEVIRGIRYDGRAADIWSCGVILYALCAGRLPFDDPSVRNLLAKVKSGHYTMPNVSFEIQDLISRMLTVSVTERITLEEVKHHSAFRFGLPESYIVPKPLPLPYNIDPIDPQTVDPTLVSILHSIGYSSDDEIAAEFASEDRTMAKIFFLMYNRLVSLQSIPWPDTPLNFETPGDDLFLMTPRQVALMTPTNNDEFGRRNRAPDVSSPGSMIQSLARNVEWAANPMDMDHQEEEQDHDQIFTDIPAPLEAIIAALQVFFQQNSVEYFYPSDTQLIVRRAEVGLYVTISFEYQSQELLSAVITKVEGKGPDYNDFVMELNAAITAAVEN